MPPVFHRIECRGNSRSTVSNGLEPAFRDAHPERLLWHFCALHPGPETPTSFVLISTKCMVPRLLSGNAMAPRLCVRKSHASVGGKIILRGDNIGGACIVRLPPRTPAQQQENCGETANGRPRLLGPHFSLAHPYAPFLTMQQFAAAQQVLPLG